MFEAFDKYINNSIYQAVESAIKKQISPLLDTISEKVNAISHNSYEKESSESDEIKQLRSKLEALQQQIDSLEAKQTKQPEPAQVQPAPKQKQPKVKPSSNSSAVEKPTLENINLSSQLNRRFNEVLNTLHITTLDDLLKLSKEEFSKAKGAGVTLVSSIEGELKRLNLKFSTKKASTKTVKKNTKNTDTPKSTSGFSMINLNSQLNRRFHEAMKTLRIKNLDDLTAITEEEFSKAKGAGATLIKAVKTELERNGLSFKVKKETITKSTKPKRTVRKRAKKPVNQSNIESLVEHSPHMKRYIPILKSANINTIDQLTDQTIEDLRAIKGAGPTLVMAVKDSLGNINKSLKPSKAKPKLTNSKIEKLEDIKLPPRQQAIFNRAMKNAKITTLPALLKLTKSEFGDIKGISEKMTQAVQSALNDSNLSFSSPS